MSRRHVVMLAVAVGALVMAVLVMYVASPGPPTLSEARAARRAAKAEKAARSKKRSKKHRRGEDEKVALRVGIPDNAYAALALVGSQRRLFRAQGLVVKFSRFKSASGAFTSLRKRKFDVTFVGELVAVERALKKPDFTLIATLGHSSYDAWVLAKPPASSMTDLKGKRIGVERGSGAHYVLDDVLKQASLSEADVVVVDTPRKEARHALGEGSLNAVAIDSPRFGSVKQRFGVALEEVHEQGGYRQNVVLATRNDVITARKGDLVKLLRGLADASDYIATHKQAAAKTLKKKVTHANVSKEFDALVSKVELTPALASQLEDELSWLTKSAKSPPQPPVDLHKLIDKSPLTQANAAAVTLP